MLLHVVAGEHLRLEVDGAPGLDVHGEQFGPLQMLAASLALCTASVISDYATTAQFKLADVVIDVHWSYSEEPYRIGLMHMHIRIGSQVPHNRRQALIRAAERHCTVHNTLSHGATIKTTLVTPGVELA